MTLPGLVREFSDLPLKDDNSTTQEKEEKKETHTEEKEKHTDKCRTRHPVGTAA